MDSANGDLDEAKPDAEIVAEPPPTVGEKRTAEAAAVEDAGGESADLKNCNKKARNGGFTSAVEEKELQSVAEIVLLLSALGTMRAGRDPTAAEKSMMSEARAKVVHLCKDLAPRDIIPREAFGSIIEDLGLNRLKEQKLGFRAPKLSIAEKMEITKKKMAESKQLIAQTPSHPAQRPQAGMGVPGGTATTTRPLSSEKSSPLPASGPASHLPSTGPVTLSFQASSHQHRPPVMSTGLPASSLGNTAVSAAIKIERPQQRLDGRPSGPSPAIQAPGGHAVTTRNTSLQPQSVAVGNIGTRNRAPDNSLVRPQVSTPLTNPPQVTRIQTIKSVMTQGTIPPMHHAVHGVPYVQTSQLLNHHIEISKMVQTFLHPKPLENPSWTLPSREYMNKVVTCLICKSNSNEVENLLICDACEKGFHLKCLQAGIQKGLPRGEWHCPKCLTINNGKPFPPKYGRVTRNVNTSNASEVQSHKKQETQDQASNLPKSMASVIPSEGNPSHAPDSSGVIKKSNSDNHETDESQGIKDKEPSSSKNDSSGRAGTPNAVCVEGSCKPSIQQNVKPDPSFPLENLEDGLKSYPPPNSSTLCTADQPLGPSITSQTPSSCALDHPPVSSQSVDQTGGTSGTDVPLQNNANEDGAPNGVGGSLIPPSSSDPDDDQTGSLRVTAVPSKDNSNEDGPPMGVDVSSHPPSSNAPDHLSASCKSVDQTGVPRCTEVPSQNKDNENKASSGVEVSLPQHDENNGLMKDTKRSDENKAMNHQLTHGDVEHNDQDDAQVTQHVMKDVDADIQVQARVSEDGRHIVDWVGDVSEVVDTKEFYPSCCVNGTTYKVNDYILMRSGDGKFSPWKLQAMWEDSLTSIKWVTASRCYFAGDLPAEVGHPSAPEANEVYESNHESSLMAGLIQGPCEVLPAKKFGEENGDSDQVASNSGDHPIFLCRWFYDKERGVFCPNPS